MDSLLARTALVLMLSEKVEASVESDRQYSECPLTEAEIHAVLAAFEDVLVGEYCIPLGRASLTQVQPLAAGLSDAIGSRSTDADFPDTTTQNPPRVGQARRVCPCTRTAARLCGRPRGPSSGRPPHSSHCSRSPVRRAGAGRGRSHGPCAQGRSSHQRRVHGLRQPADPR